MNWKLIYDSMSDQDMIFENWKIIKDLYWNELPIQLNELNKVKIDHNLQSLYYHNDIKNQLKAIWYEYKDIIVWRLIYSINEKISELLMLDTVNNWKLIKDMNNSLLIKENIVESWLWTKLVEDYFNEVWNNWVELITFVSSTTAIEFYKKILMRLIEENKIFNFSMKYQNFKVYTNNYF